VNRGGKKSQQQGDQMQVDDLMSAPVYTVSHDDTVSHVKNVMLKHKVGR
jgi:predicted transcriptional regulator